MNKILIYVLSLLFIFYTLTSYKHYRESPPKGDEVHYLLTTMSVVKDASFAIGTRYAEKDYSRWYQTLDDHSVMGNDGQRYMYHGLGLFPVILAPGYFLAGRFGAMLTMVMFSIGALYFLFRIIFRITNSNVVSALLIITIGLSLPYAEYSYLLFPEIIGVFIVAAVTWFLIEQKRKFSTCILIGLLPWIHIRFLSIALALCFIYLVRNKINKKTISLTVLSLFIITGYFFFLWFIFGNFDPRFPYLLASVKVSPANPMLNLINALTDGQYGLLWFTPIFFFLVPGFLFLYKESKKIALSIISPMVLYSLTTFSYYDWNGGYSPPGRYTLVLFPFLLILIAYFYKNIKLKYIFFFSSISIVWGLILYLMNFFKAPDYGFIYFDGYVFFIHQISDFIRYDLINTVPSFYHNRETSQLHFIYFFLFLGFGLLTYKLTKKKRSKKQVSV